MNVVIIGASNKPHRYSYQALMLLKEKGHTVIPVHQRIKEIEGIPVYKNLAEIKQNIDTLTMYVNADISQTLMPEILAQKPKRIIFNPGSENPELSLHAKKQGTEVLHACTLVLLKTDRF